MVLFSCVYSQPAAGPPATRPKPSALFVFGDSTVDAGNNNFIQTPMKSNFPPYGRDFINHIPTGRFTNGRLVSDFVASYAGVKEIVPAYLDPTLTIEDLMTGVSFASAGSGFDPMTAELSDVITMEQQMKYFKEYKSKMEMLIGIENTFNLIKNAAFLLSAGTNDFVVNYYGLGESVTQVMYPNVTSYRNFLLQNIQQFIKGLMNEGGRKIAMVGLPPMGCLPEVITLNTDAATHGRKCVEPMLSVAEDYNINLQIKLKDMQTSETKLYYADIYKPILDMIHFGTTKLGFKEVSVGCCGSGYFEAAVLCNINSGTCDDASKYVFWDAIHPTEHANIMMMSSTLTTYGTIVVLLVLLIIVPSQQHSLSNGKNSLISAVFVFGDSTVDPGNNNYLPTVARGNFPPYGKDFKNHTPTGRFTNGRLVTDFIASFVGVKENLPPYLDPSLTIEDLMTGVSFASAGAGYDPFTSKLSGALTSSQQLDLFREYKRKMVLSIGKERTDEIIKRAGYILSSGTNDFAFNYYGPVLLQRTLYPSIHTYQTFLWHNIQNFLQELLDEGAMKIGVVGAPPVGCLPAIITLNSKDPISGRQCIEPFNSVSRDYNKLLENNLKTLNTRDNGTRIVYADIYNPIINMVQGNFQTDFQEVHRGCCGSGLLEADFLCNKNSVVCPDVSKYVFWDAFHPTEKAYYVIFKSFESIIRQNIE
ncbi:hypothetical protein R6Q59_027398 [Mikania micrantha]